MTLIYDFTHNGYIYVLTDAGHTTEGRLVKYTKWDKRGQLVDTNVIQASNFTEAKHKIINT